MNEKKESYILVVGLGKSGTSIAEFLKNKGKNLIVTDIDIKKSHNAAELEKKGIRTEIGFHNAETFKNAEQIIISPGIPLDNFYIKMAMKKGIPVTGELDLITDFIDLPVIAVTGTNGKTTVTSLISEMLKASGFKVFTGGNIGTPLVDYFMGNEKADIIVAEVSSFQLDTAKKFAPDVAILLNITEDHINRYKDFHAYAESKWSIFNNQKKSGIAIINDEIKGYEKKLEKLKSLPLLFTKKNMKNGCKGAEIRYNRIIICNNAVIDGSGYYVPKISEQNSDGNLSENLRKNLKKNISADFFTDTEITIDISNSSLKGWHNRENIGAAILACLAAGGNIKAIEKGIKSFKCPEHRIEYAGTINGVDYFDDSKATNPDAVIKAIECFQKNIILILGGRSKKTDFICLREAVKSGVKKIIILGESRKKINNALCGECDILFADSMEHTIDIAVKNAVPGDIVLLSPACASFDLYESYAARGNDFVKNVKMRINS